MITLSFRRFGDGIYISHTDVLRALNRTMRRAEIAVDYSNGFNKHMALKLSQPLPLGIASDDEWVTIGVKTDLTTDEFLKRFSACCPPFLQGNRAFFTETNPSIASKVIASEYEIACPEAFAYKDAIEKLKDGFVVKTVTNGEEKTKDATGLVYEITVTEEGIRCTFAFGNKNLRVDTFLTYLQQMLGLEIPLSRVTRTKQLLAGENGFISVEHYMEKLL